MSGWKGWGANWPGPCAGPSERHDLGVLEWSLVQSGQGQGVPVWAGSHCGFSCLFSIKYIYLSAKYIVVESSLLHGHPAWDPALRHTEAGLLSPVTFHSVNSNQKLSLTSHSSEQGAQVLTHVLFYQARNHKVIDVKEELKVVTLFLISFCFVAANCKWKVSLPKSTVGLQTINIFC